MQKKTEEEQLLSQLLMDAYYAPKPNFADRLRSQHKVSIEDFTQNCESLNIQMTNRHRMTAPSDRLCEANSEFLNQFNNSYTALQTTLADITQPNFIQTMQREGDIPTSAIRGILNFNETCAPLKDCLETITNSPNNTKDSTRWAAEKLLNSIQSTQSLLRNIGVNVCAAQLHPNTAERLTPKQAPQAPATMQIARSY